MLKTRGSVAPLEPHDNEPVTQRHPDVVWRIVRNNRENHVLD